MTRRVDPEKRTFKGIELDYDFIQSLSSDRCLFCLTHQQANALMTLAQFLEWSTRWYSPTEQDISQDWIDEFASQIKVELMTDHCDIDTTLTEITNSITEINNQLTVINTAITINRYDTSVVNNYQDNLQITTILGTLAAPSCDLPPKQWIDKGEDNSSLEVQYAVWCTLVTVCLRWLRTVVYRWIYITDPANGALGTLYEALTDAGGYMTGSIFDPLTATLPPSNAQIVTAAADDGAVLLVACDLARALATSALDFASWQTAVLSLTYTADSNPDVLARCLQFVAIGDGILQLNYGAFLTDWPVIYAKMIASHPTGYDCVGCDPIGGCLTLPYTWNFADDGKGFFLLLRGKWMPGEGILGVPHPSDGANVAFEIQLPLDAAGCTGLNQVQVTVQHAPNNSAFNEREIHLVAGVPTVGTATVGGNATQNEYSFTFALNPLTLYTQLGLMTNTPYYQLKYGIATSQPATYSRLKSLTIT